jgi:hypothetical protein
MMDNKRTLMGTDNILQLQDNGYKSTVSALSEIIDNSIQANAQNIDIIIIRNTTREYDEIDEILIIDDGDGMDETIFNKALQMSSGSRSNAKSGLGKYGQGLPNSSISQSKRVEVFTMQEGKILYNHIDLNEIYESKEAVLPDIEKRNEIDIPFIKVKKIIAPSTGTIVRWVKPNRVKPKTARTLALHIEEIAGRTFRYFIKGFVDKAGIKFKCNISVQIFDFNGENFEPNSFSSIKSIKPFDPMFLMEKTQMNELFPESIHPTSELYNEPIKKTFKVPYNGEIVETSIEIKLSYCKKEERNRYGRNAGNDPFGKKYLKRNMIGTMGYNNISIIREGREIDSGSYGFIGDVSDNRERWWSAEIIVEPIIDSIIEIDNKKQQAPGIKFLDSAEASTDTETHEIIKWISLWLNENIKQVKKIIEKQNATDTGVDSKTGQATTGKLPPGGKTEAGDPVDLGHEIDDEEDRKMRTEFKNWIIERYPETSEKEVLEMVNYALSIKDNHIFIKSDLGDTQLFSYKVFGTKVLIEINYSHSFYRRFMQPFEEDSNQEKSLRSIRLLIGAMVNAEIISKTQDAFLIKDRRNIRNRMSESLDDYIEDLYKS